MIVSHRHRFIFVKTRKTAGTSVEIALSRHCGPDDVVTPLQAVDEELRSAAGGVPPQRDVVSFARYRPSDVVRAARGRSRVRFTNHLPANRIARYVGREVWDSYFTFTIERDPFDRAVSRYWWRMRDRPEPPGVSEFVLESPPDRLSNWSIYATGDVVDVDAVVRYERLEEDLAAVAARLGLDLELPTERAKGSHRSDRRHYSEVLDERARRHIERACRREMDAFGYEWSPGPA